MAQEFDRRKAHTRRWITLLLVGLACVLSSLYIAAKLLLSLELWP